MVTWGGRIDLKKIISLNGLRAKSEGVAKHIIQFRVLCENLPIYSNLEYGSLG